MKRLVFKTLLVCLPLAAVLGPALALMTLGGEFLPVSRVVEMQKGRESVLFLRAYSSGRGYKLSGYLARRPKVVALGSSRVLQFRSAFFKQRSEFYNLGGPVQRVQGFERFILRLPEGGFPAVAIVGLDQWMFNVNWRESLDGTRTDEWGDEERGVSALRSNARVFLTQWRAAYVDTARTRGQAISELLAGRGERVGLTAIVRGTGFRNDGSYYYGEGVNRSPQATDFGFRDTFDRIAKANRRFEYGDSVDPTAVAAVSGFLRQCKARGIHVIGFLPPFPHEVFERMRSTQGAYSYIGKLAQTLGPVFEEYGFRLFDFSDQATLGGARGECFDGFHASEKAYLRLLLEMAEGDEGLSKVMADPAWLRERLNSSQGDEYVFSNSELW